MFTLVIAVGALVVAHQATYKLLTVVKTRLQARKSQMQGTL